jgi:DNA-binding MarR family transcriptional regulator
MDNEESSVQLADLLQRLTRRLRRAQMSQLAPLGLTPAQERALRLITQSEEPLRMAELAHRLRIVPRSVTTVIDSLEQAGLVRRAIDPANRRAIRLHLTDEGLAVREEMREARRQASEDLFAPLSGAQRGQLMGLLSALDDSLGDGSEAASPGSDRAPAASAGSDRAAAASPARERRLRDAAARADSSASGG